MSMLDDLLRAKESPDALGRSLGGVLGAILGARGLKLKDVRQIFCVKRMQAIGHHGRGCVSADPQAAPLA